MKKRVELLAPAGSIEALHAAVENGADAVYLGGKLFNARQNADNFDADILNEALDYAHIRGTGIYLTLNTLVNDDEMKQALLFAQEAREAGIDGIIVQDLGLAGALRHVMPDVPLHGSTQMTVYDIEGVRVLEKMGFTRVVTARELTLQEASEIARNTKLEVEVFVHGALCVCYSGQCLMSSMIGGRSGNRGRCAQPCRLPYRMTTGNSSDQKPHYLLSPKDLCSLEHLPEIVSSGIRSLKIEGRMKSPEYVATVVRIYRKYLDMAMKRADNGSTGKWRIEDADMHDLLQIFNRGGFSSGYMKGKTGVDMMSFEKPNNSGIYLGKVLSAEERTQSVSVRLEDKLSVGDGVEIWTGGPNSPGGVVTSLISRHNAAVKTAEKGELVTIGSFKGKLIPGNKIYKTLDAELNRNARDSFSGKNGKRIEIVGRATLKKDKPLILTVEDGDGHITSANGTIPAEAAINRQLTEERLKEQLSKTGSTPFIFTEIKTELEDGLALPVSEMNEVRRQALDQMLRLRANRYGGIRSNDGIGSRVEEVLKGRYDYPLHGQCNSMGRRNTDSVKAGTGDPAIALYIYQWNEKFDYGSLGADRLYLPFTAKARPGFRESAAALRKSGTEVFGWLPPVTRGNCDSLIEKFIKERLNEGDIEPLFDGILAGNIGTVYRLSRMGLALRLAGDITLNLFNSLSIREAAQLGLESATLSPELTLQQIAGLAEVGVPYDRWGRTSGNGLMLETVVYGRLPLMISEYCPVGCAKGGFSASAKCSGRCSEGDYKLKDRLGMEFPVLCDRLDCRSTLLNSNVLFAPDIMGKLKTAGIGICRLYIFDEGQETVKELVQLYREAATGGGIGKGISSDNILADKIKESGFTKGHYYRGV